MKNHTKTETDPRILTFEMADKAKLRDKKSLTKEDLKDYEKLGDGAFQFAYDLKKVEIPENVKYIGNRTFCATGLRKVRVPITVDDIEECAFGHNKNLRFAEIPQHLEHRLTDSIAFISCPKLKNINIIIGYLDNNKKFITEEDVRKRLHD